MLFVVAWTLKDTKVLFPLCNNIGRASRGIDFSGVDHVVLFDFPRDPSEYVRRVGRTARGARGEGKAFVFVVGKQVTLARRIIERNQKGHPVHDVPNAYEFTTWTLRWTLRGLLPLCTISLCWEKQERSFGSWCPRCLLTRTY